MREVWPLEKGLSIRLSCSDWFPGGWTIDDTVLLAKELKTLGVDIIDCSSGGNSLKQQIKEAPGYQVIYFIIIIIILFYNFIVYFYYIFFLL